MVGRSGVDIFNSNGDGVTWKPYYLHAAESLAN